MSPSQPIRHSLLALLAEEPMYGARLRTEFEARTGGTWPLNVGQVYTTLARLERDGMVEAEGQADASEEQGTISYRLTQQGREEVARWWGSPVGRDTTPRNELAIKLALAVTMRDVDVAAVVQTQRTATVRHLQELTRLKATGAGDPAGTATAGAEPAADLAWQLVLDNLVYTAEAEVRWLDHVESRLARRARATQAARTTGMPEAADRSALPSPAPQESEHAGGSPR
ncbi:MAG TPA: PadR family transcriptional regulator [Segeticoccus sp.]|uniref:PadR family transcriptional regulator n=1 Tax=Segeticoccus sp. TaxID=2706531 RepID=UPI002D808284|nr:PadR family transcriptional regulator [Segeticoccus sp.]HET8602146.1 PadR family transcriptional regulator [Segeticoccus sp.]